MSANLFISFASQDIRIATTICKALESRGFKCWISARDILPGENFQVSIVQAIRHAQIMLLVFTGNSNNSQEMTKELALASQQKLIVIPLRVEDVSPSDAFAYEFATRQWIDLFADWEIAMEQLAERIANSLGDREAAQPPSVVSLATALEKAKAGEIELPPEESPMPEAGAEALPEPEPVMASPSRPASVDTGAQPFIESKGQGGRARLAIAAAVVAAIVAVGLAAPSLLKAKASASEPEAALHAAVALVAPPAAAPTPEAAPATAPAADPAATMAQDPATDPAATPKKKAHKVEQPKVDIPY